MSRWMMQGLLLMSSMYIIFTPTFAQAEGKPFLMGVDPAHVVVVQDKATVHAEPKATAAVVQTLDWMTPLVLLQDDADSTKPKSEGTSPKWYAVGKFNDIETAEPLGWMQKKGLLIRREASKTVDGIYQKAIVVSRLDEATAEVGGAPVRWMPLEKGKAHGQKLSLFNIYYIYDVSEDVKADKSFLLLGKESAIFNPLKPENTLIGWVNKAKLFQWDTREAAEYDKSTMGQRELVRIYEHEAELKEVIQESPGSDRIEHFGKESAKKTTLHHADPRFPLISQTRLPSGERMWNIGFAGDEFVGDGEKGPGAEGRQDLLNISKLSNVVDILIVYDGTGSMSKFKNAVIGAVNEIQGAATDFWEKKHQGELKADLRFSVTMYKDYDLPDTYRRSPLKTNNATEVTQFIEEHDFTGGKDEPAVFNGISSALRDSVPELRKESFRAMFVIGDMGNLGASRDPDPEGHSLDKITKMLQSEHFDFYAIHVANDQPDLAFQKFAQESTAIKDQLKEGTADVISLNQTSQEGVKRTIYERVFDLLDLRYKLGNFIEQVAFGHLTLGPQIVGTELGQRAIEMMKRFGKDPRKFAKAGIQLFANGWVNPDDPASGLSAMRPVVLMEKSEVERLIALLGQMTTINIGNAQKGWIQALEDMTGEDFDPEDGSIVPAEIIHKHLGIPVKSGILNKSFAEIVELPTSELTEAIRGFNLKLHLLRAVVNEKDVEVNTDDQGNTTFLPTGDKKYWFGGLNAERAWLHADTFLP